MGLTLIGKAITEEGAGHCPVGNQMQVMTALLLLELAMNEHRMNCLELLAL